ncbi:MAG: putative membrane protein [Phormidium sp. OSCR]|nr:MAG: putative membrane protein [Phormidium sp. OSCR]
MSLQNLLFVDTSLAQTMDFSKVNPQTQVVVLDPETDGIETITETLSGVQNLDSIQILSHGSAGSLSLGDAQLNDDTLADYAEQIRGWKSALADGGDLLLFGCDVAAGDAGQTFVSRIAELTGADVAASTDLTGHAALGGDWDLEYQVGAIEAAPALSLETLAQFEGVLVEVADFTELQSALNGSDTITLTNNIVLEGGLGDITADEDFTIEGNGYSISGGDNFQIFTINGGSLRLVDVTLKDGLAKGGDGTNGGGGGLGAGGAIYMDGGTLVTEGVTFSNNTARGGNANGTAGKGGNDENKGSAGGTSGGLNGRTGSQGGAGGGTQKNGKAGDNGGFGEGGGGGGGGGGGETSPDEGGDGGQGGKGGFGGGGGGGGGGGKDTDNLSRDDNGSGGPATMAVPLLATVKRVKVVVAVAMAAEVAAVRVLAVRCLSKRVTPFCSIQPFQETQCLGAMVPRTVRASTKTSTTTTGRFSSCNRQSAIPPVWERSSHPEFPLPAQQQRVNRTPATAVLP